MLSEAKHPASLRHSARFFVAALLRMTGSATAAARSMRAKHAARKIHRAQGALRARRTARKMHRAQGALRARCTAHKARRSQGAQKARRETLRIQSPGPGAHPALAFAICRAGLSQASDAFAIHAPQVRPCTHGTVIVVAAPRRSVCAVSPGRNDAACHRHNPYRNKELATPAHVAPLAGQRLATVDTSVTSGTNWRNTFPPRELREEESGRR